MRDRAFWEILESDLIWFERYIRKHEAAIEEFRGQPAYDLLMEQMEDVKARRDAVRARVATMRTDKAMAGQM